MRSRRLLTLAVPLLAGSLALTACGTRQEEGATGGPGAGEGKTVTIGLIAPISGDLSAMGTGMRNSADLAIKEANASNAIPGWTIKYDPQDDAAKADVGAQVASRMASQPDVVGVVGTLNSSVAEQVQPILDKAHILMVSPANTNPSLTQGPQWAEDKKARRAKSYFRVATTDVIQGRFAARHVVNDMKLKRVAVIHDKKVYGQGLSTIFGQEFESGGGTIVARETINPGDKDFSAVISKIKPKAPQLVYYGGEYPEASLLSNQLKSKGLNIPLMGGDGIVDQTYIQNAGKAAEGDRATSVGAPPERIASAKAFIGAYQKAGYNEPFSAYGPQAYDGAKAIIEAAKKVLPGKNEINESVRQEIVGSMGTVSFDGATGKVAFDEFGDNVTKVLTVYQVQGGKWVPVKTGTF